MKNKIYLFFLAIVLSSCEGFLEEVNRSNATADVLYSTADGYETLINACYTPARFWYGKTEGYSMSEVGTDIFTGGGGDPYPEFRSYDNTLQANHRAIEWIWGHFYRGINTCNAAIERNEVAPLDATIKKTRLGEAHFLRAFYYYHLVENFGPIPLRAAETKGVSTEVVRASVDDVYKLILDDLSKALTELDSRKTPDGGRVIKPAVEALLARINLTRGNYAEAEKYAESVINNYSFKLQPSFASLWDIANSDGAKNSEVIWFINYTSNLQLNLELEGSRGLRLWEGGNHGHMLFLPYIVYSDPGLLWGLQYGRPLGQYMPTLRLLQLFDETKDARYDGSFRNVWLANNSTNLAAGMKLGDTAAYTSKYIIPESIKAKKIYKVYDQSYTYDANGTAIRRDKFVQLSKFLDPSRASDGVVESKRDAFVFRLSDMYLLAAEAELMQTKNAEAVEHINVVRKRAALPNKTEAMTITAADVTLDFILDERARELAGEQWRWFDLKRTKKLVERVQKYNPDAATFIKAYHNVRPFPQSELDAATNKSELKQNEGYN